MTLHFRTMRVALISDLHANLHALDAVLADIDGANVDQTHCLGDIADLGPDPEAVVDRLRQRGIPCIIGNHDAFPEQPIAPEVLHVWSREQLPAGHLDWLRSLPFERTIDLGGGRTLKLFHGSPGSFDEGFTSEATPEQIEAWMDAAGRPDVVAVGHTHVQSIREQDGRYYINVGSAGMPFVRPFDGTGNPVMLPWAEYAIVDATSEAIHIEFRMVEYPFAAMLARAREVGLPDYDTWAGNFRVD